MSSDSYRTDTVACGLCGTQTAMTGTKRCDRCWELEGRIHRDPEMAAKILALLGAPKAVAVPRDTVEYLLADGHGREFFPTSIDGSPNEHFTALKDALCATDCSRSKEAT